LLEVVLAISIAVGMLLVVLFFYQQAADLRTQLLQETEQLATTRLLMDRLTSELRTTRRHSYFQGAFIGESDFIQFIKTEVPSRAAWKAGANGRAAIVESDLKLVRYQLNSSEGTNITGLARSEEPLLEMRAVPTTQLPITTDTSSNAPASLLTDQIHFLRFRYWDGAKWQASWSSSDLPQGVEVSLGSEALPLGTDSTEYPGELFRRIIYLPASSSEEGWFGRTDTRNNISLAEGGR
jgi:hypothetical protein